MTPTALTNGVTFARRSMWTHATPVRYFGETIGCVSQAFGGWCAMANCPATEAHAGFHGWSVRTLEDVRAQDASRPEVFRTRRQAANALVDLVLGRREA